MKSMALFVAVVFMFLAVDHAYGLGGGGHHGDGRIDFSRNAGNGDGGATSSNSQGAPSAKNGNTGGDDNGSVITPSIPDASIPEPVAVFLLGLGIVGLAGLRRKFRK